MAHPELKKAWDFQYQSWPVNQLGSWTSNFSHVALRKFKWRVCKKTESKLTILPIQPSIVSELDQIQTGKASVRAVGEVEALASKRKKSSESPVERLTKKVNSSEAPWSQSKKSKSP